MTWLLFFQAVYWTGVFVLLLYGWRRRDVLDAHLFFWSALLLCGYVFLYVPQITNIWYQWPQANLWYWWLLYGGFLFVLLWVYLSSVWAALRSPLSPWPPSPARPPAPGPFWRVLQAPGAFAGGWLVYLTTAPAPAAVGGPRDQVGKRLTAPAFVTALYSAGVLAFSFGSAPDSVHGYPLIGAFCHGLGLILAAIGVWLSFRGGKPGPGWLCLVGLVGLAAAAGPAADFRVTVEVSVGDLIAAASCLLAAVGLFLLFPSAQRWQPLLFLGSAALLFFALRALRPSGQAFVGRLALLRAVLDRLGHLWTVLACCVPAAVGLALYVLWSPGGGLTRPPDWPPRGEWCFGRLLGWLLITAGLGELLWGLAASEGLGVYASYRLYTIWAVIHAMTFLVLLGLLIDRLWALQTGWPVRQVAGLGLLIGVWAFSRAETISPDDAEHCMTHDQLTAYRDHKAAEAKKPEVEQKAGREKRRKERAARWFEQFQARVRSIPEGEGPVVLVAASGGGSRAAIFTALSLEALARTPLHPKEHLTPTPCFKGPERPRAWSDNIVLISSVSGGSLATAHYVHRLRAGPPGRRGLVGLDDPEYGENEELRNTTQAELLTSLAQLGVDELKDFAKKPEQDDLQANRQLRKAYDQLARVVPGGEVTPEALRKGYRDLVATRDKLRDDLREQASRGEQPAGEDALRLVTLNQALCRVRAEEVARRLAGSGGRAELTAEEAADLARLAGSGERTELTAEEAAELAWVFKNKAFDEMCLDFMAPLLRGTLTPTLGRGDALARFWTKRFGWTDATNFNGYGGEVLGNSYRPHHPLVLFNTTDVAHGSRVIVGFPPLPADLLRLTEQDRVSPRALPAPLDELIPDFRVSLARAVRLSSNFPFGFRVQTLEKLGGGEAHLLDGGVIDNTGLDTIYELFRALQWHADPRNHSPYLDDAFCVLEDLRRRGVVVLEIDAGAKPSEQTRKWYDPFGGPRESYQAMDNASYTSAELVKRFYVDEMRALLDRTFEPSRQPMPAAGEPFRAISRNPPANTVVHVTVQCNHYLPDEKPSEEVMTAWALGPRDKAQVVQRFLMALPLWNQDRLTAVAAIHARLDGYQKRQQTQPVLHPVLQNDQMSGELFKRARKAGREEAEQVQKEVTLLHAETVRLKEAAVRQKAPPEVVKAAGAVADKLKAIEEMTAAGGTEKAISDVQIQFKRAEGPLKEARALDDKLTRQQLAPDPQRLFDLSTRCTKALAQPPR
jgi:hypothetical protein